MSKSLKTLIAAVVIVGGVSSVAIADGYDYDYEYEPVGKSFAAPPVFAWTGFYAGMAAGWIRSESEAKLTGSTGFAPAPPSKLSHDADGFIAGLTLGYNQKMGVSFVGGIEADIAYTDVGGSKARTVGPVSARVATDMDWFGTVRARAGWLASQQMLLYVTGGLAYADLDRTASVSVGGNSASSSKSDWKAGWTVGGGMEWLLGNKTTLKSEYLYYDLEDSSITIGGGLNTVRYKLENKGHIVRMGLNVALY
jgi:outer membrane immunogenic protein